MTETRPDPEAALKHAVAEEVRAKRAKLHVFFGFAPGVGKTFSMLESARRLAEGGIDVVVGAVETHGRQDTAALLEGLEVLPRRRVRYRDRDIEELDLDAALARKPAVLLVDELAHTNVPGSRHKKRWQDVIELLDAGIEVHTTLNVQHVESLNDVVAQITHVVVRETVPDALLERADRIELVDIPPEELMQRLEQGKVYLGDQAARAGQNFFRRGNLLALRELALRRTAERVDADVQAYREEHGVQETWAASERILVCVSPAPGSARLVRAARRMAAGLRAPWVAASVEITSIPPLGEASRARLDGHLRLAESLGASIVRLTGPKASRALLDYARRHNVTRIVLGKPTHARIRDLVRGSLLDEVVRGSGDIDVHVISGDEPNAQLPAEPPRQREDEPVQHTRYVSAVLTVVLTTALALSVRQLLPVPDLEMLYLLAVMVCAVSFGRGPAILSAALSVAAYDFFFVPPHLTFGVADVRYLLTFAMMFAVSIVISALALRIRRQETDALSREERTRALYDLSRELARAFDEGRIAEVTARHVADAFGCKALVFLPRAEEVAMRSSWPAGTSAAPNDTSVVKWVLEHGRPAGKGTDTLPGSTILAVPIRTGAEPLGVIGIVAEASLRTDEQDFLAALARQSGFALDRTRLAEQARQAALATKAEELRSALLSAVSHDLRTPLAAITGAATTIRDEERLSADVRGELIGTICDEAERLERLVSNLLDMTRLDSGQVRLRREWVPLEEVVGSALARLESRLSRHVVKTSLPGDLPLVSIDPILFEQLFVNLLENAAKYTPPGTEITVTASSTADALEVAVLDRGPGIPAGDEEKVFERFYRGAHGSAGGVGLGLPICRAIARAHSGSLEVVPRDGGGAMFRIRIPQPRNRPSDPPEPPGDAA